MPYRVSQPAADYTKLRMPRNCPPQVMVTAGVAVLGDTGQACHPSLPSIMIPSRTRFPDTKAGPGPQATKGFNSSEVLEQALLQQSCQSARHWLAFAGIIVALHDSFINLTHRDIQGELATRQEQPE